MFYKITRGATTQFWVTGISDPLQMYSGMLDEHDWWYAILDTNFFFTDITQFLLAHGYVALTNDRLSRSEYFKWVVAGDIFLKDEVEQQLVYFKNKVFTITDTGWRPPQCIDIAPKKMMAWQKELIVLALQGMKFMHVFFKLSIVSAVPIQDH
jgi:hypothetical protein